VPVHYWLTGYDCIWKNVLQIDVRADSKMFCATRDATVAKHAQINTFLIKIYLAYCIFSVIFNSCHNL